MIAALKVANHIVAQRYLGPDGSSVESIQYLANAKSELTLSNAALSQLRQAALLGFH